MYHDVFNFAKILFYGIVHMFGDAVRIPETHFPVDADLNININLIAKDTRMQQIYPPARPAVQARTL